MKKQEIQKIKDKVSTLLGQRMVNMERWDNYAEFLVFSLRFSLFSKHILY